MCGCQICLASQHSHPLVGGWALTAAYVRTCMRVYGGCTISVAYRSPPRCRDLSTAYKTDLRLLRPEIFVISYPLRHQLLRRN